MAISLVRLAIVAVVSGTLWSLRRQARERRNEREPRMAPPAQPDADESAGRPAGSGSRPPEPDPATLTLP